MDLNYNLSYNYSKPEDLNYDLTYGLTIAHAGHNLGPQAIILTHYSLVSRPPSPIPHYTRRGGEGGLHGDRLICMHYSCICRDISKDYLVNSAAVVSIPAMLSVAKDESSVEVCATLSLTTPVNITVTLATIDGTGILVVSYISPC